VQGFAISLITTAIGLSIIAQLGFITGQTAGLALVISYLTGWSFSWVFWLLNSPLPEVRGFFTSSFIRRLLLRDSEFPERQCCGPRLHRGRASFHTQHSSIPLFRALSALSDR